MDVLTRLIQLANPQASLEVRCRLKGSFAMPHEPRSDTAPFHLVLQGQCTIEAEDGRLFAVQEGDMVMFPRGGAHWIRDINRQAQTPTRSRMSHDGMLPLKQVGRGASDLDLLCGRFDYQRGPAALLFQTLPDPLHVSLANTESGPALRTLVGLMHGEAERRQAGALAVVTALSQALFTMALRAYGEQQPGRAGILSLLADARLGASVRALLTEPGRMWTIAELGEIAAMSRATYARHFRESAGMTVWEFLTQVRMTIAGDLLLRTRRSAADIGMEVGYQSEAAFGKAFSQQMGITPGRYRNKLQSQPER